MISNIFQTTSFCSLPIENLFGSRRGGGAGEYYFLVDEFSITLLYVSSSGLKNKNYKN